MVTINEYQNFCAHWKGEGPLFAWLLQHSAIVGVSQAGIAQDFEFAASTVSRWAAGQAAPHKRVQKLVIDHLTKKGAQLLRAAQVAQLPQTTR
jgi:hypothetical protein